MRKLVLIKPKACGCGKTHTEVPKEHKSIEDDSFLNGYYWNCPCGSTLFMNTEKVIIVIDEWPEKEAA